MPEFRRVSTTPTWSASLPGVVLAALLIGSATAPLALLVPIPLLIAAITALAMVIAVYLHPPLAAYLLIALTPPEAG
jgi:hypothetical protein